MVASWARHLAQHYAGKPFADDIALNEAALHVYDALDDVPAQILATAAAVGNDSEAAEMQGLLVGKRHGYAATRFGRQHV